MPVLSPNRRTFLLGSAAFPAAAILATLARSGPALAAKSDIYTGFLSSTALDGYDTVAYFSQGKPVAGSKDFTHEWKGATWRFASAENRDAFKADPQRYAPQYGGYCAYAISQGYIAGGDPNFWRVVDGKLYVNYNAEFQNLWLKDVQSFIKLADAKWPGVLSG